jgi:hypothetical protein
MTLGSGQFSAQRADRPHAVNSEVQDLRDDIKRDFAANVALAVEEFVNPIAAGAALISAAALSTVAPRSPVLLALAANINPPRQISVTTAASGTPADAPATALVTGKDIFGNAMTETLTISQTNATVTGAKCFASVSSILEAAGDGVAATLSYGIGAPIGLGKPIKSRAGIASIVKEHANGAVVTNGVVAAAAAALPNGSYAPNTAADGTKSYALIYEYDATQNKST